MQKDLVRFALMIILFFHRQTVTFDHQIMHPSFFLFVICVMQLIESTELCIYCIVCMSMCSVFDTVLLKSSSIFEKKVISLSSSANVWPYECATFEEYLKENNNLIIKLIKLRNIYTFHPEDKIP